MDSAPGRALGRLTATGLALVLVVVLVSAAIRLGQAATPPLGPLALLALRAAHRTAASLEFIVMLWLAWLAWRGRADRPAFARGAMLALAITLGLSLLGIAAGQSPPPPAALGNALGGLALAACFAWLAGDRGAREAAASSWPIRLGIALLALQCLLGARLAIMPGAAASPALPVHAMLGLAIALGTGWFARRNANRTRRIAGFVLAPTVPLAGFTALQFEYSMAAALSHAAAVALLVAAFAWTRARIA